MNKKTQDLIRNAVLKINLAHDAICNSVVFDAPVIENRIKNMKRAIEKLNLHNDIDFEVFYPD